MFVLGVLFSLVLGSYAYTSRIEDRLEARFATRLDRMEVKIDWLVRQGQVQERVSE